MKSDGEYGRGYLIDPALAKLNVTNPDIHFVFVACEYRWWVCNAWRWRMELSP